MSLAPIAFAALQYEDFANQYIKAFEQGTTTPKVMATDITGITTASKFQLNAQGFPVTAGSALVIPFIDGPYDLWIIPTAAEADANDTTNALQIADNIITFVAGKVSGQELTTVTMTANTNNTYIVGDVVQTAEFATGTGGGGTYNVVLTSGVTPNGQDIIVGVIDALISFVLRIQRKIFLTQLGMIADSTGAGVGTDNGPIYQRALDLRISLGLPIEQGSGQRRIATALTYVETDTDADTAHGLVMHGDGMGSTIIQNDVIGTMLFIENDTGTTFAKGSSLKRFTVIGKGVSGTPDQVAFRHQAAWYDKYENVKIIKVNGTAVQSGDSSVVDPDSTSSNHILFDTCEFDENVIGFDNPQNNNSPLVQIFNTSIRNNSQGGVRGNSSYIQAQNSSISFNGLADAANAFGGIDISQQDASAFSDGFRSKGIVIDTTELDTNYPWNVRCLQAETPVIRDCSTQFRDYSTIDWVALGIATFPDAQFIFGGSGANEKCFEASFENNRVSIVANGNLAVNPTGHSIISIGVNGVSTEFRKISYNLDFAGSGSSLGDKFHIITEPQKSGANDNRKRYVEYDYPKTNFTINDILNGFSQCFFEKVFPSYAAQTGEGMHFDFTALADDTAVQLPLPQLASDVTVGTNYNHLNVTSGGNPNVMVGMRCAGGPVATILTNSPGIFAVATGTPTGTTGVDGNITIFADTDGTCWIENRVGSAANIQASFTLAPGIANQLPR